MLSLYRIKAWLKRNMYIAAKLMASRNTQIVIYTKNHPIYTSVFEAEGIEGYLGVYLDLRGRLSILERYLYNKAKLIHADAATLVQPITKPTVVECEGKPDTSLLNNKQVVKVFVESVWAMNKAKDSLDRLSLLYPSVQPRFTKRTILPSDRPITLLAVGHGGMLKGYDVVFDIYRELSKEYNVKLVIAGSLGHNFEFYPEVDAEVYAKKQFDKIHSEITGDRNACIGPVRKEKLFAEIYPSADIYLHFSRLETFGYSILEAMSFGLPVVASNLHAIPEMVTHGKTGFLINDFADNINSEEWYRKSYRQGLAAVKSLIDNPQLRQDFSLNARQEIEAKFNIANKKKTLKAVYDSF